MGSPHPRRRSRHATDDQQLPLPFSRTPDIVRDLRSIDQRVTGIDSPKLFRQWRELLIAVAFAGVRDGCRARWKTLAGLASKHEPGLIASEKTFKRVHAACVKSGALRFNRTPRGTERAVDAQRITELVRASQQLHAEERAAERQPQTGPGARSGPDAARDWPRESTKVAPTNGQSGPDAPYSETLKPSEKTSSTSTSEAEPLQRPTREEEVVNLLVEIRKFLAAKKIATPQRLESAVYQAIGVGCSCHQLWLRVQWFQRQVLDWSWEHRRGALYTGLANATPNLRADDGWPYQKAPR